MATKRRRNCSGRKLHALTSATNSACRKYAPRQPRRSEPARITYALTNGTFGTEPRPEESGPPELPPSPPLLEGGFGLRCGDFRFGFAPIAGNFSGFGVIGPSRYSKPSASRPTSFLRTTTFTWPPSFNLP